MKNGIGASFAVALVGPLIASGDVPTIINFQGRLMDGTNLVNGTVGLEIRLFNVPSGGGPRYEDSKQVALADGLHSTFIGDQTNSGNFAQALTNAEVYVETAVNGVTLTPRERIASVAYSLNAGLLSGVPLGQLALAADQAAQETVRNAADSSLSNSVAVEAAARIGADAALGNNDASLNANVAARLDSKVWAAAVATTNYVRRSGDTMSGAPTNQQSVTASRFISAKNSALGPASGALGGTNNTIAESCSHAAIGAATATRWPTTVRRHRSPAAARTTSGRTRAGRPSVEATATS
jgi:hypothetical protein